MSSRHKYNVSRIKSRHSYTPDEVSELLNVNRRTCTRWLKEGLMPLQKNTNPLLIIGADLILFLKEKNSKYKTILEPNQFYCLKCRKAITAKEGSEKIVETGKKIGKKNRKQQVKIGRCCNCNNEIRRYF